MVRLTEFGDDEISDSGRRDEQWFSAKVHGLGTDAPIVVARGEVDVSTAPELSQAMAEALERFPHRLVLDLTDVTFIDSSGIKVVLYARKRVPEGGQVVLRHPQPAVRMVFDITDLTDLFVIED